MRVSFVLVRTGGDQKRSRTDAMLRARDPDTPQKSPDFQTEPRLFFAVYLPPATPRCLRVRISRTA